MAEAAVRLTRVARVIEAARSLADETSQAGRDLRTQLSVTTKLSSAGIERTIAHALETNPSEAELQALLASTPEAPTAHVLLSANVFVAALRAIAIGVACSARVRVRASRRDPTLAEALHALAPDLFELTANLSPAPGEHVWAYGSDSTLEAVRRSLPSGVWFHPHGAGFGAVVVDPAAWTPAAAQAVALDTALFDQQGCLSPRVVLVVGGDAQAKLVAETLASELRALAELLPAAAQDATELAAARRERDAAAYAFELFDAGGGWVTCGERLALGSSTRSLHVTPVSDPANSLLPLSVHLTCIAANTPALKDSLRQVFPGARVVSLGDMQRPALDGPVDRRHGAAGELIG